jgi:hypothetical protein
MAGAKTEAAPMISRFSRATILLAAVLALSVRAHATVLDWDTATWTNGATSGTPMTGVDVNITASASGIFQPSTINYPNVPTPAITRAFDGGLSPGQNTLELSLDLTSNTQFVTVTLTFNASSYAVGVTNVSFSLFDIDADNAQGSTYQDKISNITATSVSGTTLTPTISNLGSAVTNTGGVLTGNVSVNDTGAGSGGGNATISFGGQVRSITFTYGSTTAFADPTYQHIGIHDVTFTPVPEIDPAWFGAISCVAVGFLIRRQNGRHRK